MDEYWILNVEDIGFASNYAQELRDWEKIFNAVFGSLRDFLLKLEEIFGGVKIYRLVFLKLYRWGFKLVSFYWQGKNIDSESPFFGVISSTSLIIDEVLDFKCKTYPNTFHSKNQA